IGHPHRKRVGEQVHRGPDLGIASNHGHVGGRVRAPLRWAVGACRHERPSHEAETTALPRREAKHPVPRIVRAMWAILEVTAEGPTVHTPLTPYPSPPPPLRGAGQALTPTAPPPPRPHALH